MLIPWVQWVLACALGGAVGTGVASALVNVQLWAILARGAPVSVQGAAGPRSAEGEAIGYVVLGVIAFVGLCVAGLGFALPQAVVIRGHADARRWLSSTTFGVVVGVFIGGLAGALVFVVVENVLRGVLVTLLGQTLEGPAFRSPAYLTASYWGAQSGKLAAGAVAGLILGVVQGSVRATCTMPRNWWIPASMIGCAAMGFWIEAAFQAQSTAAISAIRDGVLYGTGGGLCYGLITVLAPVWAGRLLSAERTQ